MHDASIREWVKYAQEYRASNRSHEGLEAFVPLLFCEDNNKIQSVFSVFEESERRTIKFIEIFFPEEPVYDLYIRPNNLHSRSEIAIEYYKCIANILYNNGYSEFSSEIMSRVELGVKEDFCCEDDPLNMDLVANVSEVLNRGLEKEDLGTLLWMLLLHAHIDLKAVWYIVSKFDEFEGPLKKVILLNNSGFNCSLESDGIYVCKSSAARHIW